MIARKDDSHSDCTLEDRESGDKRGESESRDHSDDGGSGTGGAGNSCDNSSTSSSNSSSSGDGRDSSDGDEQNSNEILITMHSIIIDDLRIIWVPLQLR